MYQKGKIYKLVDGNTNEILLIGSSTIRLSQKISELKSNYNKNKLGKKYKDIYDRLGADNIDIELIQSYPCNNIDELRQKEKDIRRSITKGALDTVI